MATITKRAWKTGAGDAREAWVLAYTDKTGKRHKAQFSKKREADAKRIEIEGQIKGNSYRDTKDTVADATAAYCDHLDDRHAKGRRASTVYVRGVKAQMISYVDPNIGTKRLSDITKGDVAALRDKLLSEGMSVVRARTVLATLSRALKYAEENDLLAINPAAGVRVIGKRNEGDKRVFPPSRAKLALIIKEADADLALRIRFASQTGLRASEQWALQWGDIDFKKGELTVRRTVDKFGVVHALTKSVAGSRTVPVNHKLAADLLPQVGAADAYVFPATRGGFTVHTNFSKRSWRPHLEAVAKKAEADDLPFKSIGWHALRHFTISTWVLSGMNLKIVQTLAGHSSFQMTADRYAHLLPDDTPHATLNRLADEFPS